MSDEDLIKLCAQAAQSLIRKLRERDRQNRTFDQAGILDGEAIVLEFLAHGEAGCALEHLLYMIHESEIDFPPEKIAALHDLAQRWGIENWYAKSDEATPPGY